MYINRQKYLDKLISQKDKDIVKVITGIRRCGKSVLLFNIYYDYLLSIGVKKENIIKINLETKRNEGLPPVDELSPLSAQPGIIAALMTTTSNAATKVKSLLFII